MESTMTYNGLVMSLTMMDQILKAKIMRQL